MPASKLTVPSRLYRDLVRRLHAGLVWAADRVPSLRSLGYPASHRRRLWLLHRLVLPSTWLRPSSTASLCDKRRALPPSFPQPRSRGAPGNTGLYAASPPPRRGSCTQCPAPNGRDTGALAPVHARERDRPEAALSTIRADSPDPSPSGRQRYQPCLGFDGDRWLPTRARAIVQRDDRTFHRRPLDTSLHGLMMDSKRLAHREKRWLFPIAQQYPCPLHPTRRFRSRLRYRPQVLDVRIPKRHFNRPPPRCHSFSSFVSRPPTADIGV